MLLVPLLSTMLELAPALRPWSASPPDCMENWSMASMGMRPPATEAMPPWLEATMPSHGSTLSAPSTWKLMLAVREPLTELVIELAPGVKRTICVKLRPFMGISCTDLESMTATRAGGGFGVGLNAVGGDIDDCALGADG